MLTAINLFYLEKVKPTINEKRMLGKFIFKLGLDTEYTLQHKFLI